MRVLLEGVEAEQPEGGGDGAPHRPPCSITLQELPEGTDGQLVELLALAREPLLECRLDQVESFEELAAVQVGRPPECLLAPLGDEPSKCGDIALHRVRIEPHQLRVDGQNPGGAAEGTPHPEQHLPEVVARVVAIRVAPEERRQFRAGMGRRGSEREIREERLGLPRQAEDL